MKVNLPRAVKIVGTKRMEPRTAPASIHLDLPGFGRPERCEVVTWVKSVPLGQLIV